MFLNGPLPALIAWVIPRTPPKVPVKASQLISPDCCPASSSLPKASRMSVSTERCSIGGTIPGHGWVGVTGTATEKEPALPNDRYALLVVDMQNGFCHPD